MKKDHAMVWVLNIFIVGYIYLPLAKLTMQVHIGVTCDVHCTILWHVMPDWICGEVHYDYCNLFKLISHSQNVINMFTNIDLDTFTLTVFMMTYWDSTHIYIGHCILCSIKLIYTPNICVAYFSNEWHWRWASGLGRRGWKRVWLLLFGTFSRPAKLAKVDPAPWSACTA